MSQPLHPRTEQVLAGAFQALREWSVLWNYTALPRTLNIVFNQAETSVMGTCHVASDTVFLSGALLQPQNESLLLETLCHEASHWMAFRRFGLGIEPHGPEWQAYMRRAGYEPRVFLHGEDAHGVDH
jgi:predicted SprT family Zn-dependent metalloprotease